MQTFEDRTSGVITNWYPDGQGELATGVMICHGYGGLVVWNLDACVQSGCCCYSNTFEAAKELLKPAPGNLGSHRHDCWTALFSSLATVIDCDLFILSPSEP